MSSIWYGADGTDGTVDVTNGDTTVTGSGTNWLTNNAVYRSPGYGIILPDGKLYGIQSVTSDTAMEIMTNYAGTTASGGTYSIVPIQGPLVDLLNKVSTLLNSSGYSQIAGLSPSENDGLRYKSSAWTNRTLIQDWVDFTGALAEVNVASAATCDIGAATSPKVCITGTTTITGLGSSTHSLRWVRFSGALTLTHNGTSLILPGGVNITTVAGDTALFQSDSSGNWRCHYYNPITITGTGSQVRAASPSLTTPTLGVASATSVSITGGSFAAGKIYYDATAGIVVAGKTGSASDLLLTNNAGASVFEIIAGTTTSKFSGAINYGGVTLSNSVTGTGSMVLSASPTLTGTVNTQNVQPTADATHNLGGATNRYVVVCASTLSDGASGTSETVGSAGTVVRIANGSSWTGVSLTKALTYGGVTLSNSVTGTGSMALSASPTFTGTATFAGITASGTITSTAAGAMQINAVGGFISFYEAGGATRRGYIQNNYAGNELLYATENSSIHRFTVSGTNKVAINANGLGINLTPSYPMHVSGGAGASNYIAYVVNTTASPSSSSVLLLELSGAAPNDGSTQFIRCVDTSTVRAQILSNGGLANYSANNVNLSDAHRKKVGGISPPQLSIIKGIEIREYEYLDAPGKMNIGMIAQQAQKIDASLVNANDNSFGINPKTGLPYLSIYESQLPYRLWRAMQEHVAITETHEEKIARLESRVAELEAERKAA